MPPVVVWRLATPIHAEIRLEKVLLEPEPASLNDASQRLPQGVYTTFRTYRGHKILPLGDHIRRLEHSAGLIGQAIHLDAQVLYAALHQALLGYPANEARIRLTVDLQVHNGDLYFALEPLETPAEEDYEEGIQVAAIPIQRENPESKQTAFIQTADTLRNQLPADVQEGLLVDQQGRILEGLSSNFFAVLDGVIWTAAEGILPGITRSLVLQAVEQEGFSLRLESVQLSQVHALEEAFITSSSRSVLPVRQIDTTIIGGGRPGPITRRLSKRYWEIIRSNFVEI